MKTLLHLRTLARSLWCCLTDACLPAMSPVELGSTGRVESDLEGSNMANHSFPCLLVPELACFA